MERSRYLITKVIFRKEQQIPFLSKQDLNSSACQYVYFLNIYLNLGGNNMLSMYPACFFKETDGSYSVLFPDFDGTGTSHKHVKPKVF